MRTIPLEIFVKQDAEPMYGTTTEDDGRGYSATRLPFQAYGTLGAHCHDRVIDVYIHGPGRVWIVALERVIEVTDRIALSYHTKTGMAREEYVADSASSQVFWLLFESDLTPAGKNLLDGRYACFGYTIEVRGV